MQLHEPTEKVRKRAVRLSDSRPAGPPPSDAADRYRILGSLHKGGMGEILLAEVEGAYGFKRQVVLKGLLGKLRDHDASNALFRREARLTSRLDHPNVVRVIDVPVIHGRPYLAMEYVKGRNLTEFILRGHARRVPSTLYLYILSQALRGLHHAHELRDARGALEGLVHRDISPGNILVSFHGEVKVADFGIARVERSRQWTAPHSVRGKARYLAPERVQGGPATRHTDIYSAGVVLAEALIGAPLWPSKQVDKLLRRIVSEPRHEVADRIFAQREEPEGLRDVLLRGLAIRPDKRFSTALEFAAALEEVMEGTRGQGSAFAPSEQLRRWMSYLFLPGERDQPRGNSAVPTEVKPLMKRAPAIIEPIEVSSATVRAFEPPGRKWLAHAYLPWALAFLGCASGLLALLAL